MNNDFYIGWMQSAPPSFSRHIRKAIFALFGLVAIIAGLLSLQQKRFSTASFEFGKLTEVTGIYQQFPVPSLRVTTAADAFGRAAYITIPLTGYGKFGAEGTIASLEAGHRISLADRQVTFRGTLLYSDGKTLLQIDQYDDPLVKWADQPFPVQHATRELGHVQLTGEVLDPKCYFGVMKPGHGKPHKDCAIRCIAGGMSPVFCVRNEQRKANYYLLLDENGKKMNEKLKDYVAEPVTIEARALQYDDWVILYVNSKSIKPTGGLSWYKQNDEIISCGRSDR